MSHEEVLHDRVGALRTRIRLLIAQQWLCLGLTAAAVAGLLLVAATRFQWWTDAVDYLWALLILGGVTGLIIGWTRHVTPMAAAQIADDRAGLKERLSTAVELAAAPERSEIAEAQIADAAQHAQQLRPSQILPWRVPPQLRWLGAAVALLLAAIYLPELPLFHSKQERIDREQMQASGQQVQAVAKQIEKQIGKKKEKGENEQILRRLAQEMKQLGKDQAHNRISKKQAMLKLNDLQKQLKEEESKNGGKAEKSLDKVARQLSEEAQRQGEHGNGEGQKALSQMAENLKKQDFEGAKKQLEELAKKMQSGQMSAEDAKRSAETLEQMAKAMEGSDLKEASQQMKDAAKQLQQAAQTARKFQQQMASAKSDAQRRQLQQQMSQALSQGAQQAASSTHQAGGT